jgi:hypothetical protein
MKKNFFVAASICLSFILAVPFTSCKDDNNNDGPDTTTVKTSKIVELSGDIKGNRKLVADSVYLLKGFVYVVDGATLTIAPGTIIKGEKASMGSLIVERGGKIMAEGTKDKPIVFTSNQEAGARTYGDWGGIILCGKAPVNQVDPVVEGGPRTHYGGTDVNDNSGVLKYVRIEFPGFPFQPDKEINGLTFCGVGAGTTIDYIQVSYAGDDSYEWFGGTVNCKHLIAIRGQDDEFDSDFGYSGSVQYALGMRDYRKADISGSNGFESDNDANGSDNNPQTSAKFVNVTLIGPADSLKQSISGDFKRAMHIRRNTAISTYNSVFVGWPTGLMLDGAKTWANVNSGKLVMKNCALIGMGTSKGAANFAVGDKDTFTPADVEAWFTKAENKNLIIKTKKESGISSYLKPAEAVPTLLPAAGSAVLTAADFSDAALKANTAIDKTPSFIGAFGTEDWTASWANFTPQTTVY